MTLQVQFHELMHDLLLSTAFKCSVDELVERAGPGFVEQKETQAGGRKIFLTAASSDRPPPIRERRSGD